MADDGGKPGRPERPRRAERRLAIAGAVLFGLMLLASLGLWMRHGEEIFFSRIVSAIRSCF